MDAIPADVAAMSGYEPHTAGGPHQHQWSPYVMNSGTVMAICGKDFAVIAGDTRMSVGYQIQSRNVGKLLKITDRTVLATGGHCQADTLHLHKMIRARMTQYEHQNHKPAKTSAIAQLVSQMLYNRRFFPLLTKNIIAGLDEDGVGAIYTFDVVGCLERVRVACDGSGEELIQPVLDNILERQHQQDAAAPPVLHVDYSREEVINIVKDAFTSAGEREITTGDHVDIWVIDAQGVHQERFDLKYD